MPENITMTKNAASEASSDLGQKLSNVSVDVKTKATELGRVAVDKVDENRDAAASGLESAASKIHEKADSLPGGKNASKVAHVTADKLSATANYIREHDVDSMMSDMSRLVKNNPGPALLGAAILGFIIARSLSDD